VNESVLLRNGLVFDGSGEPPFRGSVLLSGPCIAWIGDGVAPEDAEAIECSKLAIAPGFIDGHSHSDLHVLRNRPEKLLQGVTTEVVGNCGFSPFPAARERAQLHDFANGILFGDGDWGWPTAREYLDATERACTTAGVLPLVGHGTLRICVAGQRLGPLDTHEQDEIEHLLDEALASGAGGFSTGLMYSPGASAPPEELVRLCSVVARHGKVYATHMRDYGDHLVEAVDEQLHFARRTGCRLQISHFQAVGPRNWSSQQLALDHIEAARAEGVDVAFDCYPYTRGSTILTQLLPQWALEGGTPELVKRLNNAAVRRTIADETEKSLAQGWDGILIASVSSRANEMLLGKTIVEIARSRELAAVDAALDLIVEEEGAVNMLEINQSEDNLRQALTHPLSNIISDGFYVKGRPHPRLHGTFPHLLGEIVRDQQWMTMPEAIRKISALPAERFGLTGTGVLRPRYYSDITVFDPATVRSAATYEQPDLRPEGIEYVFRHGRMLVRHGALC
jgi:dihydroorotase/N-acyl-D-amino-acid deacylase